MTASNVVVFNPLAKRHLGESVGQAMLRQPVAPINSLDSFRGAGIYATYYTGDFEAYEPIARANQKEQFGAAIYVGKAVPKGARKGDALEQNPAKSLFNRLKQHAKNIDQASNIDVADFHCRYLVVDDIWIPLGESLLIARLAPLWNRMVDGFGNHDPGRGRHQGLRPRWDVLHPGRPWAERCQAREETVTQITREVRDYLRNNPPVDKSVDGPDRAL